MRILMLFCLFMVVSWANYEVYNGSTFILSFDKNTTKNVKIAKTKLEILKHPQKKDKNFILIPIGYYQKKDIKLNLIKDSKIKSLTLKVKQKNYKQEKLCVDPTRVKPPKKFKKRIEREYKEARKIYSTFSKKRYWSKAFIQPLNSIITSQYGTARMFNGSLKSYHGGTDFRAKMHTPVRASNDGVVVLAKKRYYAGGSIIIDHGQGLYTCYYHLSKMKFKPGEKVKRGQVIALSGKSGRVTGPHLHFTVILHGKSVDSQDFLRKINSLFKD